jgi:hypothetical protein
MGPNSLGVSVCSWKASLPCLQPAWEEGESCPARPLQTRPLLHPQGELVTASKAIIEKEYQPHVIVSTTGPNPFNTLTDRELEEYRREVERKQKGSEGEYFWDLGGSTK